MRDSKPIRNLRGTKLISTIKMELCDVKKILLVFLMFSGYGYAQDFEVPLTLTDGFNSQNLTIGVNRDGTDDFDEGLDNYAPPSPPSGSFDARLTWNFVDYFKDIRDNSISEKTFVITYQPGTSGSIIIYWDRDTLSVLGTFTLVDNVTGTMFNLDMTTEDSVNISSNSILEFGIKILLTPSPHNLAPVVISPIPDVTVNEDFGTLVVADLDTVFQDPDGDTLNYSAITDGNTIVSMEGSILELQRIPGFIGNSQIIVMANDNKQSVNDTFNISITEITGSLNFEVPLTVTDGFNSQNLTIGVNRNGTDDFDTGLDNYAPPSPPSGSFDTRLTWNFVDYFKDIRDNSITEKTFVITYQPGTSGSIIIYWDRGTLSELGAFTLADNVTGTIFNLDMTTEDSLDVSSNSILDFGIKILLTPSPSNLAPVVISPIPDVTIDEDFGTLVVADLDTVFQDPDGDTLVFSLSSTSEYLSEYLIDNQIVIVSIDNFFGIDTIRVTAYDNISTRQVEDYFIVNVLPINDPPEPFSLISPPSGFLNSDQIEMIFKWEESVDVDKDSISYLLLFAADSSNMIATSILDTSSTMDSLIVNVTNSIFPRDSVIFWQVFSTDIIDTIKSTNGPFSFIINEKVSVDDISFNTLRNFRLFQNFPNPFNSITRINFYLPKSGLTMLTIYNLSGQEVIQLIEKELNLGNHQFNWNASNFASGIYFYRLQAGDFAQTKKLVLLK